MAGVDKFGAAFAVAFMVAMIAFMATISSDGSSDVPPQRDLMAEQTQANTPTYTQSQQPSTESHSSMESMSKSSLTSSLKYTIRGGVVDGITQVEHDNAIKIIMDARLDGQLTIGLTSDTITSFSDGTYHVTVDGEEVDFIQVGNRLTIDFMANSQEIMIFGDDMEHDMSSMGHSEDSKEHEAMMAAEAAAEKAAHEKMMAEKAAADKAAADKAAADKAAADKAAAEKAAADKAAAEKAAHEKMMADKAAAEKAAAEAAAKAATPMSVEVEPVAGSAAPGCEPKCYDPTTATIGAGGTVTFVNSDTAPHTATSGNATDGPDGVFDSSLIMADASYSVTLDKKGTYDYFCMVHPWMEGKIIVK